MRRIFLIGAALSLVLVASGSMAALAGSGSSDRTPEELDKYQRTGEVKSCLRLHDISSTRILDSRHILFKARNGDTYLNKLPHRCGGLRRNDGFAYKVSGSRLCSVDTIEVLDFGGICSLGSFQKLELRES